MRDSGPQNVILDRAMITLEAAGRVRVGAQLRKLNDVLYAALFGGIDKTALLTATADCFVCFAA